MVANTMMKRMKPIAILVWVICFTIYHCQKSTDPENTSDNTSWEEMIYVQGGTFQMGSNDWFPEEKPVHTVTVSDFYISRHEVTFEQFDTFCETTGRESRPVINVNWFDAVHYCNWRSESEDLTPYYTVLPSGVETTFDSTANGYRLPIEAEWEYAARGGNQSLGYTYSGSNNADEVAWYGGNSGDMTHPVGQKKSNELGLHDMNGNVWEWCHDWWGPYSSGAQTDPTGPSSGSLRVRRGGHGTATLRRLFGFRIATISIR